MGQQIKTFKCNKCHSQWPGTKVLWLFHEAIEPDYCPTCGSANWQQPFAEGFGPDASSGVPAYCPECDLEFWSKKSWLKDQLETREREHNIWLPFPIELSARRATQPGCDQWNELKFVHYCRYPAHHRQFLEHLSRCRDCRQRYSLALHAMAIYKDEDGIGAIDGSEPEQSQWQQLKAASAHKIAAQLQTIRKIRSPRSRAYLKVAALLVVLILPVLLFFQARDAERKYLIESADTVQKMIKDGDLDQAEARLAQIRERAEASNNEYLLARALYLQGQIYSDRGNFNQAISYLERAIFQAEAINRPELLPAPLMRLAGIYHLSDADRLAYERSKKAYEIALKVDNKRIQVYAMQIMAISQFNISKQPDVDTQLERSIALAEDQGLNHYATQGIIFQGVIKIELKDYKAAEALFKSALKLADKEQDSVYKAHIQGTSTGFIAKVRALSGDYHSARTYYEQALVYYQRFNVQQALALGELHRGLSDCLAALNQNERAEKELATANSYLEAARQKCELQNSLFSLALKREPGHQCTN